MKKLLALFGSLILVMSFATPAVTATKYTVNQKTLASFSASDWPNDSSKISSQGRG
jgi:hypothetical protein